MARATRRAFLAGALAVSTRALAKSPPLIAAIQSANHPALDAVRVGLLDGFAAQGLVQDRDFAFAFLSATASADLAFKIAQRFIDQKAAILVPIGTPAARAALNATKAIPIVFAAVSDPLAAGLMRQVPGPYPNVAGVAARPPVAEQFALIARLVPKLKRLGTIYDTAEMSSGSLVRDLKVEGAKRNIEIYENAVTRAGDLVNATRYLAARCEVLWIPADNLVVQSLETVLEASSVPVFAADLESVARGAVASIGLDYRAGGKLAAEQVAAILKGAVPASLPLKENPGHDLVVNTAAALRFGLTLPDDVVKQARIIGF